MSEPIEIESYEDLPCNDWNHTDDSECPMKEKCHEGEVRMCGKCGWQIEYNFNPPKDSKKNPNE